VIDDGLTAAQRQRERVLWRDAEKGEPKCFARAADDHKCSGRPQCAHAYPASTLKALAKGIRQNGRMAHHPLRDADLDEVIYDPDCGLTLCAGAHEAWDKLGKRCSYEDLPAHVIEWAERWWITHKLRDYYGG
jgi:hypothetical protein